MKRRDFIKGALAVVAVPTAVASASAETLGPLPPLSDLHVEALADPESKEIYKLLCDPSDAYMQAFAQSVAKKMDDTIVRGYLKHEASK